MSKQFDVVVGNPPYQKANNKKNNKNESIWDKFIELSINKLVKDKGYVCLVHPSQWRKPEHKLWNFLTSKDIKYLEIHDGKDGKKTFSASTRYDWYIIQNTPFNKQAEIKDEDGKMCFLTLQNIPFLANSNFDLINKIITNDNKEQLNIIYDTKYHAQNKYIEDKKNKKYQYPCIFAMNRKGVVLKFSSKNNLGHFGLPKVIINANRYPYAFNDFEGEYGMCQNTFGIKVDTQKEAKGIVKALNSEKFKGILKATKWSNFQIDYRMFKYFRKDFWKEFV